MRLCSAYLSTTILVYLILYPGSGEQQHRLLVMTFLTSHQKRGTHISIPTFLRALSGAFLWLDTKGPLSSKRHLRLNDLRTLLYTPYIINNLPGDFNGLLIFGELALHFIFPCVHACCWWRVSRSIWANGGGINMLLCVAERVLLLRASAMRASELVSDELRKQYQARWWEARNKISVLNIRQQPNS